jgi:nitrite reductase/ring-hydroxylating ferredoxin subunit
MVIPKTHFLVESAELEERGRAFTFRVQKEQQIYPAFAIRSQGKVKAYLNICAHAGLTLDGRRGEFWYLEGTYLGCVQHGAIFDPDNGKCVRGPCLGMGLIPLDVDEHEGRICLQPGVYKPVIVAV